MCYFSVAMEIVYGKLGAIRVVTSQLGFARPFSIRFFCKVCCSNCHEILLAQYHHLQPYFCLSLPQLDLGGESHPPATQVDPIRAPKQPVICLNQQFFIVVKCMVSLKHSWPSITTSNPIPVTLLIWPCCWLFGASDGVPLGLRWMRFPP